MNHKNLIEKIGFRYGLLTFAALVAFFLLMQAVGLADVIELRVLNGVILVGGIMLAIRKMKRESAGTMEYLPGFGLGVLTSFVAVLAFSLFVAVYLSVDSQFLRTIQQEGRVGPFITPITAALSIFIEGAFSGAITTLCIMQFMKNSLLKSVEDNEDRQAAQAAAKPTPNLAVTRQI